MNIHLADENARLKNSHGVSVDLRDKANASVLWVQGKGRAEADAFVLLVPETLGPIQEWMESYPELDPDGPLFPALGGGNAGGHMTSRSISRIVPVKLRNCLSWQYSMRIFRSGNGSGCRLRCWTSSLIFGRSGWRISRSYACRWTGPDRQRRVLPAESRY